MPDRSRVNALLPLARWESAHWGAQRWPEIAGQANGQSQAEDARTPEENLTEIQRSQGEPGGQQEGANAEERGQIAQPERRAHQPGRTDRAARETGQHARRDPTDQQADKADRQGMANGIIY